MENKPRILQQRVQVAPFNREVGQRTGKWIGGKQNKQQKANADHPHHRQHAGDDVQRHTLAECRNGERPAAHQQHPQQKRAFMRAPGCCHPIPDRKLGIGIAGDVGDGKVINHEGVDQNQERPHHADKQNPGKGPRGSHHPHIAARYAPQRIDRQQ